MRIPLRFLTVRMLTFSAVGISLSLAAGCDNESSRSDAKVRTAIADATAQRAGRSEVTTDKAVKLLDAGAAETGASAATRAQLAGMRGQIKLDSALSLMREIDRKELELSRVAFNLGQLAVQLDTSTVIAGGYRKYDPKAVRDKIGEQIVAAQGGPDKPTWEYQSLQMPTLAAVKQKISELEGEIAKLEEEARSLNDKRETAQKSAETESQAADAAKGDESIEHFKKMSEARRQAGDLFTQIEATNAKMVPFKDDLAAQQGQLAVIDNVIKALTTEQDSLDSGWKSMQTQIDAQSALAKQIVGAAGNAAPSTQPVQEGTSIAEKAGDITRLSTDLHALRTTAQTDLDDAAKHFNDAYTQAEQARVALANAMNEAGNDKTRADVKAANAMIDALNPQSYHLQEGVARRLIGSLYASEAASLTNRASLQASVGPVIERAGAEVPAEVRPGNLAKDASNAAKLAEDAYEAADGIFTSIIAGVPFGTSGPDLQRAASVEHVLTLYGQSQVARMSGTDPQKKLDEAIAARNEAVAKNAKFPALPAALTPPPPAAPATEPTTAPSAPATEPSAAPESTTPPADAPATAPAADPASQPG